MLPLLLLIRDRIARLLLAWCMLAIGTVPGAVHGQSGALDPSFGNGGLVVFEVPDGTWGLSIVGGSVMPDGRVVVAGFSYGRGIFLCRFLANGALDHAYGTNGFASPSLPGESMAALGAHVRADGVAWILGRVIDGDGIGEQRAVFRVTASGTLDGTFGSGGAVEVQDWDGIAVASDGAILGVVEAKAELRVRRLTPAGDLDFAFGVMGEARCKVGGSESPTTVGLEIDSMGRIVAGAERYAQPESLLAVARWDGAGAPDPAFGSKGRFVSQALGAGPSFGANAMVLAGDAPVLFGLTYRRGYRHVALKVQSNGKVDPSFASRGRLIGPPIGDDPGYIRDVIVLGDGSMVTCGNVGTEAEGDDIALTRISPAGKRVASFGSGGLVVTNIEHPAGTFSDTGKVVCIAPDSKLIVLGETYDGTNEKMVIARYLQ